MALFGKNKKDAAKAEADVQETVETVEETSAPHAKTHILSKKSKPARPTASNARAGAQRAGGRVNPQYHSVRSKYADRPDAVLRRPRITEKATASAEHQAYVFEIDQNATKHDVMDAVKHFYNVTPVKVNIVTLPAKRRISKTSRTQGMTSAVKKAYVYLKAGDTIEIV